MTKTVMYALESLNAIGKDNGFTAHTNDKGVYVQLRFGTTLSLSEEEIKAHAISYLESEINWVKSEG